MEFIDEWLAFFLYILLVGEAIKLDDTYFFFAFDFAEAGHFHFEPIHNLFEKFSVLVVILFLTHFLHIFYELDWTVEDFCPVFHLLKTFANLLFEQRYFFIELPIDVDDALYLNVFIGFFSLNAALPVLIKLLQVQELEMLFTNLRQSSINNLFHFLPKGLLFWSESNILDFFIIVELSQDPWHAPETLLLLVVEIVDLVESWEKICDHIDH